MQAITVEQMRSYLESVYKHERLYGRGREYGDYIVRDRLAALEDDGYGLISRHESRSGEVVYYTSSEVVGRVKFSGSEIEISGTNPYPRK